MFDKDLSDKDRAFLEQYYESISIDEKDTFLLFLSRTRVVLPNVYQIIPFYYNECCNNYHQLHQN